MPKLQRLTSKRLRRGAFRFLIYGSLLVAGEVGFYTLVKIGRRLPSVVNWIFRFDWRVDDRLQLGRIWEVPIETLYGQASLWMFFVYGAVAVFGVEPAYYRIKHWHWTLRGLCYMTIILTIECSAGWLLYWFLGYDIWYYAGPLTLLRYTSLAIGPMWFIIGLLSENFIHIVDKLTRVKLQLAERPAGPPGDSQ